LLSERDVLRAAGGSKDADVRGRLDVLRGEGSPQGVDRMGLQRARRAAKDLVQQVRGATGGRADVRSTAAPRGSERSASAGVLLAFAYPDRVGRRRLGSDGARYTLSNGRGAHFAEVQNLAKQEFIVAVDLEDRERDARILMAAPLHRAEIEEHFADQLQSGDCVEWDSREQAVAARRFVRFGSITLEDKPLQNVPADAARLAMLSGIREMGIVALNWTREARDLQARMEFVRKLSEPADEWPAVGDESLMATLSDWLSPWLDGVMRKDHLARLNLVEILRAMLPWDQQRRLDELAPGHLQVPTGSNIRIDYLDESAPVVSVRLQEVFGLDASPRLGGNRIPITFKLLSPAQRPVQVTRDLAGFWRGSYADVRKDMRGRYPKHYWPENPLEAQPTRGVRRRT
jgi:ATP-dependent helicase HrpB